MKRRNSPRRRRRLRLVLVVVLAVALVGGAAFAAGLIPLPGFQPLAALGLGGSSNAPGSSLYWPQNSTAIVSALCKNGTAVFWVPQSNLTDSSQAIGQQVLTACDATNTSGLVLSQSQGQYLYQYSVQHVSATTSRHR